MEKIECNWQLEETDEGHRIRIKGTDIFIMYSEFACQWKVWAENELIAMENTKEDAIHRMLDHATQTLEKLIMASNVTIGRHTKKTE